MFLYSHGLWIKLFIIMFVNDVSFRSNHIIERTKRPDKKAIIVDIERNKIKSIYGVLKKDGVNVNRSDF